MQSFMDDRLWVSKDILYVAKGLIYSVWQRVVHAEYSR